MNLLRIDASIRAEDSISRALADSVQQSWQTEHPGAEVVRRDLGLAPIGVTAWIDVVSAGATPADQQTPDQQAAAALSQTLLDELLAADAVLLAVPLYNWGIPAHFKTWIDLLLTRPELGAGGPQPLAGRPAVLAISRGGAYGPGTPRDGWDHATPWLERILSDVWGLDVRTVAAELTLASVVPAMFDLQDLAAQSLAEAHSAAQDHGRHLARPVPQPAA